LRGTGVAAGSRPHKRLGGRTPAEVYDNVECPANQMPRLEPRARWPVDSKCAEPQVPIRGDPGAGFELVVSFLEERKHLPVVELKEVA
jgi:hypothetical protein